MNKNCSFCLGNDHYLRNQTAVTCPKLLDTQCNSCYKFGHTTNFCKENPDKLEKVRIFNSIHSSKPQSLIVKPKKNNFLAVASRFAALEVKECDFDNSSEYDCDSESESDIHTQKMTIQKMTSCLLYPQLYGAKDLPVITKIKSGAINNN